MSGNGVDELPNFKVIPIETPVKRTMFENYDFVTKCVTEYSRSSAEQQRMAGYLIFQFEEEQIRELKNPETPSYKTLQATMKPIMEELQVNIIVIVGHTNECVHYAEETKFPRLNRLPTLILLVACYSSSKLRELNTSAESIENKFFFFGFYDLMHLLNGTIYACKLNHLAVPFLNCHLDSVEEDLKVIQANVSQYTKPYSEQVNLLKCCRGRYEHFKQLFYEYLSKRECVQFTTEALLEKFKQIRLDDGSFRRNLTVPTDSRMKTNNYHRELNPFIFKRSDGIPCTDEGNCSKDKTNYAFYKENLKKFDDSILYGNETAKKLFVILDQTTKYTPEQHRQADKEILTILKALPTNQAVKLLQRVGVYRDDYGNPYYVPMFFFIFAEKYTESTYEILKSYDVPLDSVDKTTDITLVRMIFLHMNGVSPRLTEKDVYRLWKAIGRKNPNAIQIAFSFKGYKTKLFNQIFRGAICYLSLIECLFRYFPSAISEVYSITLYDTYEQVRTKHWTLNQAMKVLELILSFNKMKYRTLLENQIEGPPPSFVPKMKELLLPSEFIILMYVYIQDVALFPDTALSVIVADLTSQLTNASLSLSKYKQTKLKKLLKEFGGAKAFFDKRGVPPERYRKTIDEMNELLDEDLESIEISLYAIDNVKTYFSTVQPNIQKRKDLNTATKSAAIQQFVSLYKDIKHEDNIGENSLRRLREMHKVYKQFLANHPRENKKLPSVNALTGLEPTEQVWLIGAIESFQRSVVVAKPKTVRRPRAAKVLNSATLQQELLNIQTKLNSHNRGVVRLHHMTVKSLRKKKNALEKQVRNAIPGNAVPLNGPAVNGPAVNGPAVNGPAVNGPAVNGPRNNNNNNNQAGGRRTRKIRR